MLQVIFEFLGQMFCLIFGLSVSLKAAEGFGEGMADAGGGENPITSVRNHAARVVDAPLQTVHKAVRSLTRKAFSRRDPERSEELREELRKHELSEEEIDRILDQVSSVDAETIQIEIPEKKAKKRRKKAAKKS